MDPKKLQQQMMDALAQAQQLQEQAASETVEASAGGGMVTVKANGAGEITEIKIAREAIDPDDPEMLADLVLAAVNEAIRSGQKLMESKMGGLMGGLGGLGGLPGM
jgi:DNA-binding YbaB/EbfC family protein